MNLRQGYKPGMVLQVLGITREQLRYWRRELDTRPTRAYFTFQMIVGYGVLRELVVRRWINPKQLKRLPMGTFFAWFEENRSSWHREDTVICIHRDTNELRFLSKAALPYDAWAYPDVVEKVELRKIEGWVTARITILGP